LVLVTSSFCCRICDPDMESSSPKPDVLLEDGERPCGESRKDSSS
jgi:hypothetical protein